MHITKDSKKNGTVYFRYKYRDKNGVLKTIPVSSHSHLDHTNYDQMLEHLKYFEAKYDSRAKEKDQRESWHDKYHNFQNLLEIYTEAIKEKAPRSWESKVAYFRFYVLPFFLTEKGASNLEEWRSHFGAFRKYLKKVKQVRSKKLLSLNSQNHCITELNNFLTIMSSESPSKCEVQPKCAQFEDRTDASLKSLTEVFEAAEIKAMYQFLSAENENAAYLFMVLVNTGMRISEALGIGPSNILKKKVPHDQLNNMLKVLKLDNYQTHIFFNRQLDNSGVVGDEDEIVYVPLKAKNNIHERYMRYVPIFDKATDEIISILMRRIKQDYQEKKYGGDKDNYLLFGRHLSQSILYNLMVKFYESNKKFSRKSPHDCRHSMSTWLAGKDISGTLGKIMLGQTEKTQQRYNHLAEQMARVNTRKTVDVFDDY